MSDTARKKLRKQLAKTVDDYVTGYSEANHCCQIVAEFEVKWAMEHILSQMEK